MFLGKYYTGQNFKSNSKKSEIYEQYDHKQQFFSQSFVENTVLLESLFTT
jgi:hypothetical protein